MPQQGTVQTDTDGDGMLDEWEDSHGLDKNDKTDGNAKGEGGYTNLEIYMNALVADITNAQNEGGELLGTTLPDETASLKENRLYPIDSRGNGFYYTLQGIRTTTPINGIYIQNGHKVIVK